MHASAQWLKIEVETLALQQLQQLLFAFTVALQSYDTSLFLYRYCECLCNCLLVYRITVCTTGDLCFLAIYWPATVACETAINTHNGWLREQHKNLIEMQPILEYTVV